jgi:hypothetical protein
MPNVIDAAGKSIIANRAAAAFQPCKQARANIRRQLELRGPASLLLNDNRSGPDLGTGPFSSVSLRSFSPGFAARMAESLRGM